MICIRLRSFFLLRYFLVVMAITFSHKSFSMPVSYDDCDTLEAVYKRASSYYSSSLESRYDIQNLRRLITHVSFITGLNRDGTLNKDFLANLMDQWTLTPTMGSPVSYNTSDLPLRRANDGYLRDFVCKVGFTRPKKMHSFLPKGVLDFFRTEPPPIQAPKDTWMYIVLPSEFEDARSLFNLVYTEVRRLEPEKYQTFPVFLQKMLFPFLQGYDSAQIILCPYFSLTARFWKQFLSRPMSLEVVLPGASAQATLPLKAEQIETSLPGSSSSSIKSSSHALQVIPPSPVQKLSESLFAELKRTLPRTNLQFVDQGHFLSLTMPIACISTYGQPLLVIQHAVSLERLMEQSSSIVRRFHPDLIHPNLVHPKACEELSFNLQERFKITGLKQLIPWLSDVLRSPSTVHCQPLGHDEWYDGFSYQLRIKYDDSSVIRVICCQDRRLYTQTISQEP